jgi:CheY-like chemotaxis protein
MVHELRRSGFDLTWERVDSEADYLAYLEKSPEIVLADYALPQFRGLRALELLQQQGFAIPFLVVSGTMGDEAAVAIMKQGATDYILKDRLVHLGPAVMRALQGERKIAYFSMEISLESAIPTYSGGLGVLAGDTIRSAADLQVPMVAISLLHRAGHFHQRFDATGWQKEEPKVWQVEQFLAEMPARTTLSIEGRKVCVCAAGDIKCKALAATASRSTCSICRFRFHDLRHTYGSLLIQDGAPLAYVKEQMGHSSIQITVDAYGHLIPAADIAWVDRLDSKTTPQQNAPHAQLGTDDDSIEATQVVEGNGERGRNRIHVKT